MTVEEKIQALLVADDTLIKLVPAARIKVPGNWQNLTRPYIVHFPAAGFSPLYSHSGLNGTRQWNSYQVSIYADSYGNANSVIGGRAIADRIRDVLTGVHDGVHIFVEPGSGSHYREPDTNVHRFVLQFTIFEAL